MNNKIIGLILIVAGIALGIAGALLLLLVLAF